MGTWHEDCMKYYGRVLMGSKAHYCPEFDYLPIDETCDEIESCSCEFNFGDSREY